MLSEADSLPARLTSIEGCSTSSTGGTGVDRKNQEADLEGFGTGALTGDTFFPVFSAAEMLPLDELSKPLSADFFSIVIGDAIKVMVFGVALFFEKPNFRSRRDESLSCELNCFFSLCIMLSAFCFK
jgi:hypothetical protein